MLPSRSYDLKFNCAHCNKEVDRPAGHVNRSCAKGMKLYCSRRCFGLDHRDGKSKDQRKEEKRLYDIEYRQKNLERILARKREYHKRTYNPAKAAIIRKKNMPRHVEYCRRPEYKIYKKAYDKEYRARRDYGSFAEVFFLVEELEKEINRRMDRYEIKLQNDTLNKAQKRRRAS